MPVLSLWRMSLLRLARTGWLWGPWVTLLLAPLFLYFLRPLAPDGEALRIARAWAFPAGLLGACLAVNGLESHTAFLLRLSWRERWGAEWGSCLLAPLFLQLPTLVGACLAEWPTALDLGRTLADILCADLHLAGLALLSLSLPMPATARTTSLCVLTWVAPALLAPAVSTRFLVPFAAEAALRDSAAASSSLALGFGLALLVALWRTRARASFPR